MTKTAALVHYYFGEDSYINRIAQETVPVHLALEGYDKTILLRHETDLNLGSLTFELSEKAERKATKVLLPTPANFSGSLNELGEEGYVVDLYIFSHGYKDIFLASKDGSYKNAVGLNSAFLERHVNPLKLRMVYGCHCYGSSLNASWMKLGARVTSGARHINFYPTRFRRFVNAWNRGYSFGKAVEDSGTRLIRTPAQLYMIADAMARRSEWDGGLLSSLGVLGRFDSAEAFFSSCWLGPGEWKEGASGRENMNSSSFMVSEGDIKITKQVVW